MDTDIKEWRSTPEASRISTSWDAVALADREITELRARIHSDAKLIAEQNRLAKERQEWALHTNKVIRDLRAALALAQAPSAPVAPIDERAAFEAEISKLADRVDFERYTEQKAARNNHSFPAPQFKPVEIGDYVLSSVQSGWRMWQARAALSVKAESAASADPVVELNVSMLRSRSAVGVAKYGVTMADNKLSLRMWLVHALEESLDHANYLQRAMQEIDAAAPTPPKTGEA